MSKIIISVFDTKAKAFYAPELVANEAVIERYYNSIIPENSIVRKFPKDFEVWKLGRFSEETGKITPEEPRKICTFSDFLANVDKKQIPEV